jgi:hypothetical protein
MDPEGGHKGFTLPTAMTSKPPRQRSLVRGARRQVFENSMVTQPLENALAMYSGTSVRPCFRLRSPLAPYISRIGHIGHIGHKPLALSLC